MNIHVIVLGFLFLIVAVNARHFENRQSDSEDELSPTNNKSKENGGDRHRRKRYHMSYGYDYPQPSNPFGPYRREYDRNQDLLPEIYRLLEEISANLRRPPPPPQPIYIPYTVPYPVCNCQGTSPNAKPTAKPDQGVTISSRYPEMVDSNQNWGFVNEDDNNEEEGDGSRPLSFTPIQPKRPLSRPPRPLDHGTQHARAPAPSDSKNVPDMCDVFALSCCNGTPDQQKQCFISAGCASVYNKGNACEQERLLNIIDSYSKAYAPVH